MAEGVEAPAAVTAGGARCVRLRAPGERRCPSLRPGRG